MKVLPIRPKTLAALAAFFLFLSNCSKENLLRSGDYYLEKGIYPQAIRYYQKYLDRATHDENKIAAHLGIARSWGKLGHCSKSLEHYEKAAEFDPLGPASALAQNEILNCGDFFPLETGRHWQEVDSETLGKNYFATYDTLKQPGGFVVRRKLYAGRGSSNVVHDTLFLYAKEPGLLWERLLPIKTAEAATLLLRFPYEKELSWVTKRQGQEVRRTITDDQATIKVAAGAFSGCIEILEETLSGANRIYDTYCPGTGRVKSAIGRGNAKEPHTELWLNKQQQESNQ
ncbi:MAG: hypothetical protein HY401_08215 [Elusimicrobia bacterium]|nr:hypothetical protein [Elusimicrobiota bacterium]